ncbi:hypothetical protein [Streptomyces sp. NPDC058247]|uniref:hypothetical protein n=1 Tax=Streptomyces sp. NPDC058247 TaxID=3346401 RepID=UPI0036E2227F
MHAYTTADAADLTSLVETLLGDGVISVALFSTDGLTLAAAGGLTREAAERSCAAFSGMQSFQRGLAEFFHAQPGALQSRVQISDFTTHTLLLVAAGHNTGLGVAVEGESFGPTAQMALRRALKLVRALDEQFSSRDRAVQRA